MPATTQASNYRASVSESFAARVVVVLGYLGQNPVIGTSHKFPVLILATGLLSELLHRENYLTALKSTSVEQTDCVHAATGSASI